MNEFMITTNAQYRQALEDIITSGEVTGSRIGDIHEVVGARVTTPLGLLLYRPQMSRKLGWTEALQVVGAMFDPVMLNQAAPKLLWPYTVNQAYGIKIATQMPKVAWQLMQFPGTRRAVVHIGQPMDGQEEEKPCVQSYQFLERNGFLYMTAYVRSWDFISGFIYDQMVASMVGMTLARLIGLRPGMLIAFATSLHIYEKDIEYDRMPKPSNDRSAKQFVISNLRNFGTWDDVVSWARNGLAEFPWYPTNLPPEIEVTNAKPWE